MNSGMFKARGDHEIKKLIESTAYLQRGTLHESESWQSEEWRRKSCDILLQCVQPTGDNFRPQVAKWRMRSCSPSHVLKLVQGLLGGRLSCGPTSVQPSVQICCRQSMASFSCLYISWAGLSLLHRFFRCAYGRSTYRNKDLFSISFFFLQLISS